MRRVLSWVLVVGLGCLAWPGSAGAQPVARQITAADVALLFGGSDAAGGIGDWYVSNGVVQAIIDGVGTQDDLAGIVPAGQVPPIQSEIAPTGGTLIDLGRVGADDDQLPQLFLVGGFSTSNFALYDTITTPAPGVVRASGTLLLTQANGDPIRCVGVTTDYVASGTGAFLTLLTTATNGCTDPVPLSAMLDVIIWVQRGIQPFSGGGRGFDHPALDLDNLLSAVEGPVFLGAPGVLSPADGVTDPASGTSTGEVSYGLLPIAATVDVDGGGPTEPTTTGVANLIGISNNTVSALGTLFSVPMGGLPPGGTVTYERRVYAGDVNDVRSVSDPIFAQLASRTGTGLGTIAGDVDAVDAGDVPASIVVVRLGRCGSGTTACAASTDCAAGETCTDSAAGTGFAPGAVMTQLRTAASGAFSDVTLPVGDYRLTVSAPERTDVVVQPVTVAAGQVTQVAVPTMAARGRLHVRVREKGRGRTGLPAKVVVKGVSPTPDPRFNRFFTAHAGDADLRVETFGGGQTDASTGTVAQGNVVYLAGGDGTVPVAPGTYDVWAARGPEYTLARKRVTVTAGNAAEANLRIKRVLKTPDALSADFHVHSARSFDSSAPLEGRVVTFAAEGVEVMVSTDHDKHVDYAPIIASLGLGRRLTSIPGVEITGEVPNPPALLNSIGHINAWPMPVVASERRDGAVEDEYVAPNWVFTRLRRLGGADTVVQYNHPRAGAAGLTIIGFFNSIGCGRCSTAIDTTCTADGDCPGGGECTCVGYQPDRTLDQPPNDLLLDTGVLGPGSAPNPAGTRNIDFDVMEIENGATTADFPPMRQTRDDWFSLLQQGVVRPGTAVSDSHRLTVEHAGWSRTFVLGAGDDPTRLDVATFNGLVKAGRMVMSAGPYVEVRARSARSRGGVGDMLTVRGGKVALRVRVQSAPWIPVEEVRVIVNGQVVQHFDAGTRPRVRAVPSDPTRSGGTLRFARTLRLAVSRDAWVVVEAGAKLPADRAASPPSPGTVDVVEPGVVPFAIANPIFLDADGDGRFTPPGLGTRARAAGTMTGVTRAARAAAVRRGEYVPLRELSVRLGR